jgi:hypothetical protein
MKKSDDFSTLLNSHSLKRIDSFVVFFSADLLAQTMLII